ncbi:unnamed protein product [Caretta caretta]
MFHWQLLRSIPAPSSRPGQGGKDYAFVVVPEGPKLMWGLLVLNKIDNNNNKKLKQHMMGCPAEGRGLQTFARCSPSSAPHECLVLARDFNTILEEKDHSGTEQCPAASEALWETVDHPSLVDVWHDHHPDNESTFTYVWIEADRSCHSQLDLIYLSRRPLLQAHSCSSRLVLFLDHHLMAVAASLTSERLGLAYWHFNNNLLGIVASFREFWLAWRGQRSQLGSYVIMAEVHDVLDLNILPPIDFQGDLISFGIK